MAQMSSEEALNGIFNILDTMVNQHEEKKKETLEQKADSTIVSLLQGIVETAKDESAATVGEQLEKLSKGLVAMESIDNDVLNKVATSIGNVNTVLSSLKVDNDTFDNIDSFLKAINKMTEINAEGAKNIVDFIQGLTLQNSKQVGKSVGIIKAVVETLGTLVAIDMIKLQANINRLDVKSAKRMGKFITTLINSISKANPKQKDIEKLIKPIGDLMGGISKLVDSNVFKMKISLNPIRGWLLGRQLGQFITSISKYLKGDLKVDESIKYLGGILDPLVKLADPKQKFSVFKLARTLNKVTATILGDFFATFVNKIPKEEQAYKTVNSMVAILTVLFDIKKMQVLNFKFAVSSLTEKRAQKLVNFFNTILTQNWDADQVNAISGFFDAWNNAMRTLLLGVIFIALTIKVTSFKTIVESVLVVRYLIKFMKNTVTDLVTDLNKKDVKDSSTIIEMLSISIGTIGGILIALSLVTKLVGIGTVVVSLLILRSAVNGFKNLIKDLSDQKLDKSLKYAQGVLTGIGLMVMSLSVSLLLLALTVKNNSVKTIIASIGILTLFVAGSVYLVNKLSSIDSKNLNASTNAMLKIAGVFAIIALVSATLLAPIGNSLGDVMAGGLVVSLVIALGIFAVKYIAKANKDIEQGASNLLKISLIFALVSIISLALLIPIGKKADDVIGGAIITLAIIGGLIYGVQLLNKVNGKRALWGLAATAILAVIYMGIALISKDILVPIGQNFGDIMIGAIATMFIVAGLIFGVYMLSKINGKHALWSLAATVVLAVIYMGIALITKDLLIPIGQNGKEAGIGMGITLFIIAALIFGTYILSKVDGKKAGYAILATAAMAFILLGISLITKDILIPIGKKGPEAQDGAGVVLGIIAIFGAILFAIGKMNLKHKIAIKQGAKIMMEIGLVMLITGTACLLFAIESRKLYQLNDGGAVVLGALTMTIMMGLMGLILYNVGKLKKYSEKIAEGGALMIAIGALLDIIGGTMLLFSYECKKIDDFNKDGAVFLGAGTMVALLAVMGVIMTALGTMTPLLPFIAAGAVVMTAIAGIMTLVSGTMILFMKALELMLPYNEEQLKKIGKTSVTLFDVMYDVIKAAAPNPIQMAQAIAAGAFAPIIMAVFGVLTLTVMQMKYITEICDSKMIQTFSEIMLGKSNSVLGSMQAIVKAFGDFDGKTMALIVSMALRPILTTISDYIDIIMKIATMNYIAGYDDNGKPMYEHLPATVFADAASTVTKGFTEFLTGLSNGFKGLDALKIVVLSVLTLALNPIIDTVGKFVDVVMKIATGTYIIGYDNNKKPIFKKISSTEFSKAASAVSLQFNLFLQHLSNGFSKMSSTAMFVIATIGQVMEPVMDAVSKFVDAVIKVSTMQIVTGYDKNGKPIYEPVEPSTFGEAAKYVSEKFKDFIDNLGKAFTNLQPNMIQAMDAMKDSIVPIMEGVGKFVDSILKLATGMYIKEYKKDKDGNYTVPVYDKVTKKMYEDAADVIAQKFASFIDKLVKMFERHGSFWGNKTEDALNAIGGSIGPVMEGLGKYVDSILKLATGTYIKGYDRNKNPIFGTVTTENFKDAAKKIADSFVSFIDTLIKNFANEGFIQKAESIADIIKNTINPIMHSVKMFSDMLKPFLALTSNKKGTTAQSKDYLCLQPNFIRTISTNIANAFVDFITIISNNLSKKENMEKYNKIQSTAKVVNAVMKTIKTSVDNLKRIITAMTDDKGKVLSQGNEVASKFTSVLTQLATYFSISGKIFETSKPSADIAQKFVVSVYKVVGVYRKIINQLSFNTKVKPITAVTNFGNVLTKMQRQMIGVSKASDRIDFRRTSQFMDLYLEIAKKMIYLSREMQRQKQLGIHINMFINNIKRLTSPEINRNMNVTSGSMRTYTARLKTFTAQIQVTTSKVEIYTTKLEAARRALKSLDDEIINKEKARNNALQQFANKINNIAVAVDRMKNSFDRLDENAILNRFDGIRELLDLITTNTCTPTNTPQHNNVQQQVHTAGNRVIPQQKGIQHPLHPGQTNHNYYGNNIPTQGRVTFYFKNTTIDGFFRNA